MTCIWRGDMTLVSDLVKLRAILENTHTWAMREQRPRISAYIDLWKYKYPPSAMTTTTTATVAAAMATAVATTMATATTAAAAAVATGGEVEDDERGTSLAPSLAHLSLGSPDLGSAVDADDLVPAVDVDEQVDEAVRALLDDGVSTPEMGSEGSDGGDELESEDDVDAEYDPESEEDGDSEYNPDDEDELDAEEGLDAAKEGLDAIREGIDAANDGLEAIQKGLDAARKGLRAGTTEGLEAAKEGLDAAQEALFDAEDALEGAEQDLDVIEEGLGPIEEALDYLRDQEHVESEEDVESEEKLENQEDLEDKEDLENEDDVENEGDVESEEDLGSEEDVDIEDCGREDGLRTGDESAREEFPEPEELAEEEESIGGDSADDEPLTWTGVLTWGEQTIEGKSTPEEQPVVEEPAVSGELITREESAWEKPAPDELSSTPRGRAASNQPDIREESELGEPPSTPRQSQHSTSSAFQPSPSRVLQELASGARPSWLPHQNTGPDSDSDQPRPLPEAITWIDGAHTSLRYWNIFKNGIYLPHAWLPGGRIRVKLPPAPETRDPVPVQPQAAPAPAPPGHTFFDSGALAWIHPTTTTTDIHLPPGRRIRVRLPDPKRQTRVPEQQQQAPPPPDGRISMFESLARSWIYPPPTSDATAAAADDNGGCAKKTTGFEFKAAANVKPVEDQPPRFRFNFATTPTPPAPTWPSPPNLAWGASAFLPPTPPSVGNNNNNNTAAASWKPPSGRVGSDGPASPSAGRGGGSIFSLENMRGALPPTPEPTPWRERKKSPFGFSTP